ncbi:MAG: GntR family transcriptional regulator, partial [Cellulomonas sp.]|nr:GntR family transcriptional regulator [Cellulomonas sp.]
SRVVRPVLPEEDATMGVPGDTVALEVRRAIMADGEIVAYSYDLMPMDIFPADFDPADLDGSIFGFFRTRLGIVPDHALGEVHAVTSNHVGWGTEAATHNLFVLLVQRHYDKADKLVLYSRTYFIEGRYSFSIVRHG